MKYKLDRDLNNNLFLFLVGQIIDTQHLITRIIYYSKFIKNIILITFEISVKDIKDIILKYIKEENLFLIPSNKTGDYINNKKIITPYKITQPNNSFYYDSSYFIDATENGRHYLSKVFYYIYPVFRYMQLNKNK